MKYVTSEIPPGFQENNSNSMLESIQKFPVKAKSSATMYWLHSNRYPDKEVLLKYEGFAPR